MAIFSSSQANRGEAFLKAVGTFWTDIFTQRPELTQTFWGNDEQASQFYLDFSEACATLSRFLVPVHHRDIWYLLVLSESDLNTVPEGRLKYGDGAIYGHQDDDDLAPIGTIFDYGEALQNTYAFPVPDTMKFCPVMTNRIFDPSLIMTYGVDYYITDTAIVFRDDPFTNDLVPRRPVYDDDGVVVDNEISLWCTYSEWDWEHIWRQYGYVLGVSAESSETYRRFINALWNLYVGGPTVEDFQEAVGAACDIEFIKSTPETVNDIVYNDTETIVITDKETYRFLPATTVVVSIGDELKKGDLLVDAVEIIQFQDGNVPDVTTLPAIGLDKKFISGGIVNDLAFENRLLPTEYLGEDADGYVEFRFHVSGTDADVETFWDNTHAKGKLSATMAELLDIRPDPQDQPMEESLPSEINPLAFMVENVIGNNLFVVKLKPQECNLSLLGLSFFRFFREIMAPQTTYAAYIEMTADTLSYDLEDSAGES